MQYRFRIIFGILLVLVGVHRGLDSGQNDLQSGVDDLIVLGVAETAVQLGQQFPDSIWPRYNLDRLPLIIYVPDRWALLLNAPAAEGFGECPAAWPSLGTPALCHPGRYGDLVGRLAFDLPIGSTAVAAVAFTGQSERAFLEYVIHENFHQFQHACFGEIPWEREELYPIEDAVNTSLASLEAHLLRDAVDFADKGQRDSTRRRVSQFAAVRGYRWRQADSYVRRYEQGQEINEGTAKYVELKGISLVPRLHHASSEGEAGAAMATRLGSVAMPDCLVERLDGLVIGGTIAPEDMPRNRIYPVGAAQGFLLDCLSLDWKALAQKAGPEFTFVALLRSTLELDSLQEVSLVTDAKQIYDFESILKKSEEAIAAYRGDFDDALRKFESQPGIRVDLTLNGKNLMRSRSSNARKYAVDSGSRELRDHYDVYVLRNVSATELGITPEQAELSGLLGREFKFQLKDSGLLEVTDWNTKDKELVFYCPRIQSLTVDGAPQSAATATEYTFDELKLIGTNFELQTNRPGRASISSEYVAIELER